MRCHPWTQEVALGEGDILIARWRELPNLSRGESVLSLSEPPPRWAPFFFFFNDHVSSRIEVVGTLSQPGTWNAEQPVARVPCTRHQDTRLASSRRKELPVSCGVVEGNCVLVWGKVG